MSTPTKTFYINEEYNDGLQTSSSIAQPLLDNQGRITRDPNELEGTLLPIAQEVFPDNNNSHQAAPTAVPIQFFDYDVALANENEEEQEQDSIRIAHPIPFSDGRPNPNSIADDSQMAVKNAEHVGRIKTEEELDAIRKANTRVYTNNYYEHQAIQLANQIAQQRNKEGLKIKPKSTSITKSNKANESTVSTSTTSSTTASTNSDNCGHKVGGGYQIHDYQLGETNYETSDYDVKDYKSVYD
jgi:hypothetical protein